MKTQSNHPRTGRSSRLVFAAILIVGLAINVGLPFGLSTTPVSAANSSQVESTVSPSDGDGTIRGVIIGNGVTSPAVATTTSSAPTPTQAGGNPSATPPPTVMPTVPPALLDPKSIEICHAVGNGTYNDLTTDVNGVINGHASDVGDIIPPFTYSGGNYPGRNWDTVGVAVWTNGCIPLPTATSNVMQPALLSTTNCAYTPLYWTMNTADWPVRALTIGGLSYTQAQVERILLTNANGDVSLTVFQQLAAVMLSVAHGADSSAVQATINASNDWLWDNPPNSRPSGTVADKGNAFITTLSSYSTGAIGPGHCPNDTSVSPALQPALQPGFGKPVAPAKTVAPHTNAVSKPGKPLATARSVGPQTNATSRPQTTNIRPTMTPATPMGTPIVVEKKVTLCHASAAGSNAYVSVNVSIHSVADAYSVDGHGDHTGGIWPSPGWGDIIPPYTYQDYTYPGMNWTDEGKAIYNNDCSPISTPTPTATNSPAPNVNVPTASPTPVTVPNVTNHYDVTCQKGQAFDTDGNPCSDPWYGTHWLYSSSSGWWKTSDFCMSANQCASQAVSTPPPSPKESSDKLPCKPTVTADGFVLDCTASDKEIDTWNILAQVDTSCPINHVNRSPYPRAMVNMNVAFNLLPQSASALNGVHTVQVSPNNLSDFVDAQGNPTQKAYEANVWRNMVLTMRSYRLDGGVNWFNQTVPQPQWTFTDRSWNTNAQFPLQQQGTQASYVYQTTSAGLSTIFGRAFDMTLKQPSSDYNLPAYGVNIQTFCGHEWMVTYQIAGRAWQQTGACYQTMLYPDGSTQTPDGTSNIGCDPGWVAPGKWAYEWVDKTTSWAGINMTQMGRPNTYDVRTRTQSGGVFNGQQYWDDPTGVWVPVVEVQSVLREECVAKGTCNPPVAHP